MSEDKLFVGKNGFFWWFGRVESNGDPLGLGRCQVRIHGWHSDKQSDIPTAGLPWAFPVTPITNAGIGGIGITPVGPVPGTRVIGFFADGEIGMQPMILGVTTGHSVQQFSNPLEYGSTPNQPNYLPIAGMAVNAAETACPSGPALTTATANTTIPDARTLTLNTSEWACPATGFINSAYGERSNSSHNGVDICPGTFYPQTSPGSPHLNGIYRGPVGNPVYAAADGIVVYIWTANVGQGGQPTNYDLTGTGSRSFGNAIAISHTLSTGNFTTIYAHLGTQQDAALDQPGAGILVTKGQTVTKGQQIGTMGRTHNFTTPTHLHFEIRTGHALPKNSNHINPGRIFPQMANVHSSNLKTLNKQKTYNQPQSLKPSDAPIIALEGPAPV